MVLVEGYGAVYIARQAMKVAISRRDFHGERMSLLDGPPGALAQSYPMAVQPRGQLSC